MHPKSIVLDHCWVCGVRFTDALPPGPELREDHHVIPRRAGGEDGPTCSVCERHHGILHKIANHLSSGKPYFHLIEGHTTEQKKKLYWLASRVYNAFQAVSGDPNKQVVAMIVLSRQEQEMIDVLKKIYPKLRSRESVINFAVQSLYKRHIAK
jgi:hypothetical protein